MLQKSWMLFPEEMKELNVLPLYGILMNTEI
jgi:hypothetical protein